MMLDRSIPLLVKEFARIELPEARKIVHKGEELLIVEGDSRKMASMSVIFKGGNIESPAFAAAGIGMNLLKESTVHRSGDEGARIIDFHGAWLKNSVGDHSSSLNITGMSRHLPRLIDLTAEILLDSAFNPEAFEIIKANLLKKIATERTKVTYHSAKAMDAMIYGTGHPLALSGDPEAISALSLDEIRDFMRRVVLNQKPVVYLAGEIDSEILDAAATLKTAFNQNESDINLNILPFKPSGKLRAETEVTPCHQNSVTLALPFALGRDHEDYHWLRMAVFALGGYFGSRLMSSVREEKGYTYNISGALMGFVEGSAMTISTTCDPAYTEPLIEACLSQIRSMAEVPLSEEELRTVKMQLGAEYAMRVDTPFSIASYLSLRDTINMPADYFAKAQQALADISATKLAEVSRKYLDPSRIRISIAGKTD